MEEEDSDLREPEVVTKYKTAAEIANKTIANLIPLIQPGKTVLELCQQGDGSITEALKSVYTKGKIEKGVAFPTCISLNNCVGHFSPLGGDPTSIQEGDVVKVNLGVHIDGHIATVGHTVIALSSAQQVEGRKADVICAAHFASEAALRLLRPGNKASQITATIQTIADIFHCNPVDGVFSHQVERFVIEGEKFIPNRTNPEQKIEDITFVENEVYSIDIVMSTGEGRPKETETRTTVFKRAVEQNYLLKMKASRYVLNEINAKFPTMPFSLRAFEDEKKGRLGIVECVNHGLVSPYPVLYEKQGESVAQFQFTALLLPTQTDKITSYPRLPFVKSQYSIEDPKIKAILALGTKRKSNNKKQKKKKKKTTEDAEPTGQAVQPAQEVMDTSN